MRLLTTWPCIVEASYLLATPQRYEMLHWVELGGALVYPFEPYHLGDMIKWMRQYSRKTKREMNLAGASLYWLAIETGVTNIMTTDVADFHAIGCPTGGRSLCWNDGPHVVLRANPDERAQPRARLLAPLAIS